jgi:uncharacterized protein YodC (DUF2158 family)
MKPGDVVCLKSGGPRMTVAEAREDGMMRCLWFTTDHQLQNAWFSPKLLAVPNATGRNADHDIQGLR